LNQEASVQFKRNLFFVFFASVFLLNACNLAMVTPTPEFSLPVVASQPAVVAASTVTSAPTTPTITAPPTPTLTLFYDPTITATPSWLDCPLIITRNDTNAGDLLHIRRCEDNLEYDLGPFANGVYAAGPDNKFIIYVTDEGVVYAAKLGEQYMYVVVNLVKEHFFAAINKKALPRFVISFAGEAPRYKLVLIEKKYNQKRIYNLPARLME
jgi:hypothetical protein